MKFDLTEDDGKAHETDILIICVFEGQEKLEGDALCIDIKLDNEISNMLKLGEIKTNFGSVTTIHTLGFVKPRRLAILGCGEPEFLSSERFRNLFAETFRNLMDTEGVENISISYISNVFGRFGDFELGQFLGEAAILGLYKFDKYKSSDSSKARELNTLSLLISQKNESLKNGSFEKGISTGLIIGESVNFARDMVNEPSNYMTPAKMAELASDLSGLASELSVEIIEREGMADLGMGALLGVSQGSQQQPKLIVMRYLADKCHESDTIGLLGKGITFDSGGLDIKSATGMRSMKGDMAGGAAVIASLKAVAMLGLKVNVVGIVPAVENMPGGSAQRPGDVVKTMNGKTIEIGNTDAEGRLVLADAMAYAVSLDISKIVDVATLTGAISVALGDQFTGAFGNDQEWVDKVIGAGNFVGENIWQLPISESYSEQYKSNIADINNIGTGGAGSIIGAMIIGEFAKNSSWVHLDIAGTSRVQKDSGIQINGATGVTVRTFVQLLKDCF